MLWYGRKAKRRRYRLLVVLILTASAGLVWMAWPAISEVYQRRSDVRVLRTLNLHNDADILVSTEVYFHSRAVAFPSDYSQKGMLTLRIAPRAHEALSRFKELPPPLPVMVFAGSRATYVLYLEQPGLLMDEVWEYELACYEISVPLMGSPEVQEIPCEAIFKFSDRYPVRVRFVGHDVSGSQERFIVSLEELGGEKGSRTETLEFVVSGNKAVFRPSDRKPSRK